MHPIYVHYREPLFNYLLDRNNSTSEVSIWLESHNCHIIYMHHEPKNKFEYDCPLVFDGTEDQYLQFTLTFL